MTPLTADDSDTPSTLDHRGTPPEGTGRSPGETVALAEELLTRRSGARVRLADVEDLGGSHRSRVVRVRVAENPFSLPRTLVVKHYLGPVAPGGTADRVDPFPYEAASCQLFTAMPADDRATPTLYANDPQRRLLVLEDLGRGSTLADKLHGDDPKGAERALLGATRALGRLQAATAAREGDFGALLRRSGVRHWRDPLADDARSALAEIPDLLAARLRVEAAPAAVAYARSAAGLLGGTRYRAFSPSEISPENCLLTGAGARFLDFEWGCFRDVAFTASSVRLPFPGWAAPYSLPTGMAEAMTASWQSEVAGVWPELADPAVAGPRHLAATTLWVWVATRSLLPVVTGEASAPEQVVVGRPHDRAAAVLSGYWQRLRTDAVRQREQPVVDLADAVTRALAPYGGDVPLPPFPAFARA
ncbi:hypothetical protein [Actinomycetospora termitidis]|uniref:Aminoglycoside phosphotransferase domain-containing protein n=1 Tax=Actinomycetospora termitidis TaxID=3053470 RepID=A0ABT7MBB9_9PSEU|nr:hypothetical protein [Actinomycetospora sp. Odt1-22]MDL5157960.1 hypothetical protein [Actinomycetospora sp. Odt1-22]